MWSALPDPDAFRRVLPPAPVDPHDSAAQAAWWTPLVHLARFGLGLPYPAAGLREFLRTGGDSTDAAKGARRLIDLWWGERVEEFLAWGTGGGDQWLLTGGSWPLELPRRVRLPERSEDDLWRLRRAPRWQATWAGGGDPLHLADHSQHPLAEGDPVHVAARGDHLVLHAQGYGGWYRALMKLAELAPEGGTEATVEIHGFGELGTYAVQPGQLPRLCALPALPRSHPSRRRAPSAPLHPMPHAAHQREQTAVLLTVLRGSLAHLRDHPGTRFVLDVPTGHGGEAYTQAMSLPGGRIYAEVPSDQFLAPPLTPYQHVRLAKLGWSQPNSDTPNHWREWPAATTAETIADTLLATLVDVYDVTGGEFSLAPAALAAQVVPDNATLTLASGEGTQDDPNENFRSWLATIERAGPSPTAVALSVARCPEVDAARAQTTHPCRRIVTLQPTDPHRFQVPEAWAGNIRDGRIVFISSNPSISEPGDHQSGAVAELYPTADWADEDIADFVRHRFDSPKGWATEEGRFRRQDGTLSPKPVAFWNNVRRRAGELLERDATPAADYAMTEVVHCKSKAETGVAKAALTCADRHLDSILALSPAGLVVVLGQRSRALLAGLWPLHPAFGQQKGDAWRERDNIALVDVGGRQRLVVYLWHPTGATAPKTFAGAYPLHLERLRALVRGEIPPAAVLGDLHA